MTKTDLAQRVDRLADDFKSFTVLVIERLDRMNAELTQLSADLSEYRQPAQPQPAQPSKNGKK